MNVHEFAERCCQEPTLIKAMALMALWESERVVKQAHEFLTTGVRTTGCDRGWDTCFERCFDVLLEAWEAKGLPYVPGGTELKFPSEPPGSTILQFIP